MPKVARFIIAAVIIAILAAAVYLTKPGGNPGSDNEASGRVSPPVASESHKKELPSKTLSSSSPFSNNPQGSASKSHDDNAVVRAGEGLATDKAKKRQLAVPDWSAPTESSFRELRKLRRYYRKHRDFSDEDIARLHGAAVVVKGALMPIDPVPSSGKMDRFWLANPVVVMAGCVFCNPPTMADLLYVKTDGQALKVDRERLYRSVVSAKLVGRFELGPVTSEDGVEYMFGMKMKERLE